MKITSYRYSMATIALLILLSAHLNFQQWQENRDEKARNKQYFEYMVEENFQRNLTDDRIIDSLQAIARRCIPGIETTITVAGRTKPVLLFHLSKMDPHPIVDSIKWDTQPPLDDQDLLDSIKPGDTIKDGRIYRHVDVESTTNTWSKGVWEYQYKPESFWRKYLWPG